MTCPWKELLGILPPWLRLEADRRGRDTLQEIHLRIGAGPELVLAGESSFLNRDVTQEDVRFVINMASRYSPWASATTAQGYITAPGGHRIGLCGEVTCLEGSVKGIRQPESLCIRVCRDFPGIASGIGKRKSSLLILGAPGWGKTTLLRDIARTIAETDKVSVVDERGEVFPQGIYRGKRMDVMTGCPKPKGIDMVLRTMSPDWIAVDEITGFRDCNALRSAAGCGVRFLATAHASSRKDLYQRPIYRSLTECGLFDDLCILKPDKTFHLEKICL